MLNRVVRVVSACAALTVMAMSPLTASANFTNRVLQSAGGAFVTGTSPFFGSGVNSQNQFRTLDVSIDYAVWAPETYNLAFDDVGSGLPLSLSPSDYVYAYQIYNVGAANGGLSDTVISQLGVSSLGPVSLLGENLTFDPDPTQIGGTFSVNGGNGGSYFFLTPEIAPDSFSSVLLLSSPQGPITASARLADSGVIATGNLPTPVPEPTTFALLGLGAVTLWWRRRSK